MSDPGSTVSEDLVLCQPKIDTCHSESKVKNLVG